jgi:N-acetylmuramoyl-L-alanine amidase
VTLTAVTHTPLPKGDRVTFELSREPVYTTERLPRTNQLRLSLSNVGLSTEALDAVASLRGSLVQFVQISATKDGTDVMLQFNGQPRHSAFPLYDPYRLVVDIETEAPPAAQAPVPAQATMPAVALKTTPSVPASTPANRLPGWASTAEPVAPSPKPLATLPIAPVTLPEPPTTSSPAPPASTSRGGYSLARQLGLGVSRIVIDPGHGGHDPGAVANGVSEAELVLDVALRLEKLLQDQPGFEVVLTRRTNDFIALEERTALANKETADLFLSIHANSSPQRDTRGIETYFLNFASNSHAEAVAARENASSVKAMRNLPQLVKAITTNNKLAESREFANIVQTSLLRQARAQNKSVKDLGVKQAPFVVLLGAEMPSVLAEIAFVTNRSDATLLKQQAYRQRIAQALRDAVLRYQSSLKKVTTVTASAEGR